MKEDMIQVEEWKPIAGYVGSYEISSMGRVRSVERLNTAGHRLQGKLRATYINQQGDVAVTLRKDGKYICKRIKRMVAESFVQNPSPDLLIDVTHKDFDRTNNLVENLEWVSHEDAVRAFIITEEDVLRKGEEARRARRHLKKMNNRPTSETGDL